MNIYRDKRNCNWFWIDNNLIRGWGKDLGPTAIAVYACLCMYAGQEEGKCFPSITTIAEALGIARQTVITALRKLEEKEIIDVKHGTNEGVPNIYTLNPLSNHQEGSLKIELGSPDFVRGASNNETLVVQKLDSNYTQLTIHNNNNTSSDSLNTKTQQYNSAANFDAVYAQYPRKMGRKAALKHFQSSIKTEADLASIQDALNNYKAYLVEKKIEDQYVQHASTWFNNWRDWIGYYKSTPKPKVGAAGREL